MFREAPPLPRGRRSLGDVLLGERAGRYHYVLVVGRTVDTVVVHDSGRAPGLRLPLADFLSRWEDAGRWALVVLRRTPADIDDEARVRAMPGRSEHRVPPVAARDEASPPHPLLVKASDLFRALRWRDAAEAAHAASRSNPSDPRAWTLLASTRFCATTSTPRK